MICLANFSDNFSFEARIFSQKVLNHNDGTFPDVYVLVSETKILRCSEFSFLLVDQVDENKKALELSVAVHSAMKRSFKCK